ncbi:MAG: glutathione S-transferase family protein [Pseudomonadota bacterium]
MDIHFYHAPGSRSDRVKMLLRLLAFDYRETLVDTRKGEHKTAAYAKVNPLRVVPGMTVNGRPLVESIAQMLFLADLDPGMRFAPAHGAPARARYLQWMVMIPASAEPMVAGVLRDPADPQAIALADQSIALQTMFLEGPFCLGDRLSALDMVVHWNMRHMDGLGVLERHPAWRGYVARLDDELDWAGLEQRD